MTMDAWLGMRPTSSGTGLLAQAQALVQAQAQALALASEATTVAETQRDRDTQGRRMLAASLAAATDENAALQTKHDALQTKAAALQALLEQERSRGSASKLESAAALAAGREQAAALTALEVERESERTVHAKLQAEQRRTGHTHWAAAGPATCGPVPSHSRTSGLGAPPQPYDCLVPAVPPCSLSEAPPKPPSAPPLAIQAAGRARQGTASGGEARQRAVVQRRAARERWIAAG